MCCKFWLKYLVQACDKLSKKSDVCINFVKINAFYLHNLVLDSTLTISDRSWNILYIYIDLFSRLVFFIS